MTDDAHAGPDGNLLHDVAHARAGDKGDRSNVVLIPYDDADYEYLAERVTAERVRAHFAPLITGDVERYEIPELCCLNFVVDGALDGGVTTSSRLDRHGKSLSYYLLSMRLE